MLNYICKKDFISAFMLLSVTNKINSSTYINTLINVNLI